MERNIWFTSDQHYGHKNIIRYCGRPFSSVEEMDEALIANYNEVVKPQDTVYHLGDFSFHREKSTNQIILDRLNGRKHLIVGNHDTNNVTELDGWHSVSKMQNIYVGRQYIVMCHYPLENWHHCGHGSWMLHGHEHGYRLNTKQVRRIDVGVDPNDLRPIPFDELVMFFKDVPQVTYNGQQEVCSNNIGR